MIAIQPARSIPSQTLPAPVTDDDLRVITSLRQRLLDEQGRLTAADVSCGNLCLRLGGACLTGLHFQLTMTGTLDEVSRWIEDALALLDAAARYVTPLLDRAHVVPTLPDTSCAEWEVPR
jgi:hypothetical protein